MELVTSDGKILGGADAVIELAGQIWWGWPLWALAQIPGSRPLLRALYRGIAARRYCVGGGCQRPATPPIGGRKAGFQPALPHHPRAPAGSEVGSRSGRLEACPTANRSWIGWVLVFGMAGAAFWVQAYLPAWAFMWVLALAMFAGCKWVTWRRVCSVAHEPSPRPLIRVDNFKFSVFNFHFLIPRSLGYLAGWVGMDAEAFLGSPPAVRARIGTMKCRSRREEALIRSGRIMSLLTSAPTRFMEGVEQPVKPARKDWWLAGLKTCFGGLLVWGVVRLVPATAALVQGWLGLAGLAFLLHFGLFHLLALAWQRAGVDAQPIMRAPILATSVGEFWGQRWNKAFHQLAHEIAFRPLRRKLGARLATVAVFLLSGLVHEAVISLPARAGFGLPTGYFLLQGLALLAERSWPGRRLGLGRGWRGWLWTFLWTAGLAPFLFHPPFIHKVILPFLNVIGAL